MAYRESAKEINLRKVKTLMKNVKNGSLTKKDAAKDLNQRFDRMKKEDGVWYEEMYPKYVNLMRIA